MNDEVLFASAPYVAAFALLVAAVYRSVALSEQSLAGLRRPYGGSSVVRTIAVCASLALAALHVVLLSAPNAVLRWNRSERRLLLLEIAGFLVGAVCLVMLGRMIRRQRTAPGLRHGVAIGGVAVSTLIGIEIVSGLMLALLYRWASSWSVVTLTPYAVSLLNFNPRVELVASMPFLVRLHVFGAFATLVAVPFTTVGSTALFAARRAVATAAAPVTRASRLLRTAAGEWTRRRVRPLVSWNDEGS
jgi:nitrate reductase gamma subunit